MTDLLHNKGGNSFAQLAAGLHNAKTKWYYFSCEQEVDDIAVVHLNKCSNDTKRRQAQIFKGPSFADGVEKRVQEQRDMRLEKAGASVRMTSDALQQRQSIANSIRCLSLKHGRVQHWVYACYLLKQNGDGAEAVPKNWRKVRKCLALLAEFEKGSLASINAMEFFDEFKQSFSILS